MLMCRIQVSHSKILSSKKWKGYKTRALYLVYFTHTMSVINGILTQGEGRDWTWTLQQSFSGFVKMKTEKRDAIFQDILSTLGISDDCCMRIVEEEKQEIWWIFFFFCLLMKVLWIATQSSWNMKVLLWATVQCHLQEQSSLFHIPNITQSHWF